VLDDEAAQLGGLDVRTPLLAMRDALTMHLADAVEPELSRLQPYVDDALRHSDLVLRSGRAHWVVSSLNRRTPARRIALDLVDQLIDPPGPIGRCADPACGWAFVDTSRAHRRRWCSSADCGNRERVRRHAARS
jgi:predicted RNA-binding Zn ribbon-like protein